MKKFAALFTDSYRELKSVKTITTAAMFAAVAVILGMFSINLGNTIRIGFSGIPNGIVAYLFGPVVGGVFGGTLDILKYIMKPTGPFFPGLTLVVVLADVLYGCIYYRKPLTFKRVLIARFFVALLCNVFLNTWCLSALYGKAFAVLLPARALKNLIMWPIDSLVFYSVAKSLDSLGLLRRIRNICMEERNLRAKA